VDRELDKIKIYYTIIPEANWLTPEWLHFFLDEVEMKTYQRYLVTHKKFEFLIGRALLKTVLADFLGIEIAKLQLRPDEYGKLYLTTPSLNKVAFNLSHSQQVVACVVAENCQIGVDVEKIEKNLMEIAERFFAPQEIEYLKSFDKTMQKELIYRIWTLKEAYIKAEGKGLSISLQSFSIFELSNVFFKTFQIESDYLLSVAVVNEFNENEYVTIKRVEFDRNLKIKNI